jgi:HSP20 family molecular chaperone IbpA
MDLELSVEPRGSTMTGKRKTLGDHTRGAATYLEQCSYHIFWVFAFPADVGPSETKATLKNGIPGLESPKAAIKKPNTAIESARRPGSPKPDGRTRH